MLEQEVPQEFPYSGVYDADLLAVDLVMVKKHLVVDYYESQIDRTKELYLFTFSPTPDNLPDADFNSQHEFAMSLVVDFLQGCELGLACVESNLMGNPHYHGWFQKSEDFRKEQWRIAVVKTMAVHAPAGLRFTKCKGHYHLSTYCQQGNALHYYKKDLHGAMQHIPHNPITQVTVSDIDYSSCVWWFNCPGKKKTVEQLEDKLSNKKFYEQFYMNSDPPRKEK